MISEELKAIINKLNEQGKMVFLKEQLKNRLLSLRKTMKLNSLKSIKSGCSILTVANCFFPLEYSFMVRCISQ